MNISLEGNDAFGIEYTAKRSGKYKIEVNGQVTLDYRRPEINYHGPLGTDQFIAHSQYLTQSAKAGQLIVLHKDELVPYQYGLRVDLEESETIKFIVNDARPFVTQGSGYNDNKGRFEINISYVEPQKLFNRSLQRSVEISLFTKGSDGEYPGWWSDPNWGSLLWKFDRSKNRELDDRQIISSIKKTLEPLLGSVEVSIMTHGDDKKISVNSNQGAHTFNL